jgi:AcrR family transcriptional regulator
VTDPNPRDETRSRIVAAAAALLHERGRSAVTTRAVADAAGVQAPTIYRLFGDKDGLLEAVAEHAMTAFAAEKARAVRAAGDDASDPVEDLRTGWAMTIGFGLANPHLFTLLADPERGRRSPAARAGVRLLADRVRRVAEAGRLAVPEDRAVHLVQAAGTGAVLAVLAMPAGERDASVTDDAFAAVLDRILVPDAPTGADVERGPTTDPVSAAAITLRAAADGLDVLSAGERVVLAEWLDRVVADR